MHHCAIISLYFQTWSWWQFSGGLAGDARPRNSSIPWRVGVGVQGIPFPSKKITRMIPKRACAQTNRYRKSHILVDIVLQQEYRYIIVFHCRNVDVVFSTEDMKHARLDHQYRPAKDRAIVYTIPCSSYQFEFFSITYNICRDVMAIRVVSCFTTLFFKIKESIHRFYRFLWLIWLVWKSGKSRRKTGRIINVISKSAQQQFGNSQSLYVYEL